MCNEKSARGLIYRRYHAPLGHGIQKELLMIVVTDFDVEATVGNWERCSVCIKGDNVRRIVIMDYDLDLMIVHLKTKSKVLPLSGCNDYGGDIEEYLTECLYEAPSYVPKPAKERETNEYKRSRQLFRDRYARNSSHRNIQGNVTY